MAKRKANSTEAAAIKAAGTTAPVAKTKKTELAAEEEIPSISVEELHAKILGFESLVGEVKYLKTKLLAKPDSSLLNREIDAKLKHINTIIRLINKKIV